MKAEEIAGEMIDQRQYHMKLAKEFLISILWIEFVTLKRDTLTLLQVWIEGFKISLKKILKKFIGIWRILKTKKPLYGKKVTINRLLSKIRWMSWKRTKSLNLMAWPNKWSNFQEDWIQMSLRQLDLKGVLKDIWNCKKLQPWLYHPRKQMKAMLWVILRWKSN